MSAPPSLREAARAAAADEAGPAPAGAGSPVAALGEAALDLLEGARGLYSVFVLTLYYTFRGRREKGAVARQMYEIGNRSLFFLCVVMAFLGMILVFQAGMQIQRVVPDLSQLGAQYVELLVRELAPSVGALMLATRVGAGIAAEIGSMVVTEQVDALRMCAADPVDFLIKPRFLASLVMTVVLIAFGTAVAYASGMAVAYAYFGILPHTFVNAQLLDVGDVVVGFAKCLAYGAAIPVVSGYCGLSTYGGSEGVGWATTRAVVNSSLAVIVLDFFISGGGYLVFPG